MAIIGKNVIENLTTAMYEDLKIIYREYIQNSADSIDKAISLGVIDEDEAKIDIEIDAEKNIIRIIDNGIGIKKDSFKRVMSSIAASDKDLNNNKGFRGIGRLGGISSCKILKFITTSKGENVKSTCVWNAEKVKDILIDKNQNPTADNLVDSVTEYYIDDCNKDDHYFMVELIGIDESSRELLDEKNVKEYLKFVAPIPYDKSFMFSSKIMEFAEKHGFRIDTYNVFVNGDRLFKPYTNKLYEPHNFSKKGYDEIVDIKFHIFEDNDKNILAWMWYGICKFEKQIPQINSMRGIRLRKSNIQIGNENTFTSHNFYKEPRGALYFIGEVFAVNSHLIPNARRDYFNLNDVCRDFEDKLKALFYDRFYQIYHYANEYKKILQVQIEAKDLQKKFKEKENTGFIDAEDKKKAENKIIEMEEKVKKAIKKQELRDTKEKDDDVLSRVYDALKKTYNTKVEDENINLTLEKNIGKTNEKTKFITQSLSQYNKREQKLISKIYMIINKILPKDTADLVISKIQEDLQK